jgi:tetratricopeptide (TPR) repeat protein
MKERLRLFSTVIILAVFSLGNISYLKNQNFQKSQNEWLIKSIKFEDKRDWNGMLTHSLTWTEVQPQEEAAWFSLGNAYAECERYTEAIESYKHALNINNNYADIWFNLGLMYSKVGQYNEAIGSFKQSVNIDKEFLAAWVNLGITCYQVGQTNQVKEVYEVLKKLDQSTAEEFNNLFILH